MGDGVIGRDLHALRRAGNQGRVEHATDGVGHRVVVGTAGVERPQARTVVLVERVVRIRPEGQAFLERGDVAAADARDIEHLGGRGLAGRQVGRQADESATADGEVDVPVGAHDRALSTARVLPLERVTTVGQQHVGAAVARVGGANAVHVAVLVDDRLGDAVALAVDLLRLVELTRNSAGSAVRRQVLRGREPVAPDRHVAFGAGGDLVELHDLSVDRRPLKLGNRLRGLSR